MAHLLACAAVVVRSNFVRLVPVYAAHFGTVPERFASPIRDARRTRRIEARHPRARGSGPVTVTPMMQQYEQAKRASPGALLLFRMGDFYELFYDDAELAAKTLGLTLTTRDKNRPNPVPMAGFPHHQLEGYLAKLVAAGLRGCHLRPGRGPETGQRARPSRGHARRLCRYAHRRCAIGPPHEQLPGRRRTGTALWVELGRSFHGPLPGRPVRPRYIGRRVGPHRAGRMLIERRSRRVAVGSRRADDAHAAATVGLFVSDCFRRANETFWHQEPGRVRLR